MYDWHADPLLAAVWTGGTICALLTLWLVGMFALDRVRYRRYERDDYFRTIGYARGYLAASRDLFRNTRTDQ